MSDEPLFRVWDKKYKKWAGIRGEKGRTFEQYWREKMFRQSNLIWCDIEGFAVDENGGLVLNDECGNSMGLSSDRFQVCFEKERLAAFKDSESGNYKIL